MSAFYTRMAATTQRLLAQFGQEVTLRRTVNGPYDPVIGGVIKETVEQRVTCVVLPASKGTVDAFDQRFVNETLIETNLRAIKLPAQGLEWAPEPNDEMDFDGHTWRVIGVTAVNPDGTALSYNLSVRR